MRNELSAQSANDRAVPPKLSICICTFNRAKLIGAIIESIVIQLTEECELLVFDNGSTDETEQVVARYARGCARLRYVRHSPNLGIDRGYDRAIECATGEYCWLMPDDDVVKPGALSRILKALQSSPSVLFVNVESRNFDLSQVLQPRWLAFGEDRVYRTNEIDTLFEEMGDALKYLGCCIIRRELWLGRERAQYYGSLYIHIGVIFQRPLPGDAVVVVQPCIIYRWGNAHAWSSQLFETLILNLPALVQTLSVSDSARRKLCSSKPWTSFQELLFCRAKGCYSLSEYRRLVRPKLHSIREAVIPVVVALLPGLLVNAWFVSFYSITGRLYRDMWQSSVLTESMKGSCFHLSNWPVALRRRRSASLY